jgi:hypothetical protein
MKAARSLIALVVLLVAACSAQAGEPPCCTALPLAIACEVSVGLFRAAMDPARPNASRIKVAQQP